MNHLVRQLVSCCLVTAAALAQGHFLPVNDALLGVVTRPHASGGAEVVLIVEGTPAKESGVVVGDRIVKVQDEKIAGPSALDRALAELYPGQEIEVVLRRGSAKKTLKPTLMRRRHHRGEELRARERGKTGFAAIPWHIHSWSGLGGKDAPELARLRGKVIVIHAFQSG